MQKISNNLGTAILNKYWNVFYFYYKGIAVQMCNQYKDFYLSVNQTPYSFKTDLDVIAFIDNLP